MPTAHKIQPVEASSVTPERPVSANRYVPLLVELEGTLLLPDTGWELLSATLSEQGIMKTVRAWREGRLSNARAEDAARLPYRDGLVSFIRSTRQSGRPVYLLTGGDEELAEAVAAELDLFDGIIVHGAGRGELNTVIRARIGETPFDIAASSSAAASCFKAARQAYAVDLEPKDTARLRRDGIDMLVFSVRRFEWRAVIRLLRPHQYAKNALVAVPLLTSHQLNLLSLYQIALAFLAFSMAASAVYVLNDFIDMRADRAHPVKRMRPLAAGTVRPPHGLALIPVLLLSAALLASALPLPFSGLLAGYLVATTAYSFALKKMMLVDVIVLALLYTTRVVAGAAAITVPVSEWLFAFSLLMFTALALTKRHVELLTRLDRDMPDPSNRDYKISDLPIIAALAAAAGMNAVTVLALYVNSAKVTELYTRPALLWLLCPLILYWSARTLLLAHRRLMHDDPIVFALRDRTSWIVGALCVGLVLAAM